MAATVTPAALFVLAALLVPAPPRATAALPCSTVYSALMPCLGYVKSGGRTVPPACCAAIKQLVSGVRTTPDRRAICACLKDLAAGAPAPYIVRAVGLPDRCGVKLGYKLSPDMNCKSIK